MASIKRAASSPRRKPKMKVVKAPAGKAPVRVARKTPTRAKQAEAGAARSEAPKDATDRWSTFLENGGVDPLKVSRDLGITKADLADTLGLPADALLRVERIMADKTQSRLSELLEILSRIEAWSGGLRPAFAWYRSQGIAALGDETAEAMVKTNRAAHVRTYLNAIAAGSFA